MPDINDRETVTHSLAPERFARVRGLFEAALERPARERRAYLEGACGEDLALLEQVSGMLAAEAKNGVLDGAGSTPASSSSSVEEGRFPAGTVLAGRYRVLGMLGRGGMGEVYKAFDLILNQVVALKFLNPAYVSEAALARFRNEVRIARQVSHPNVCRVYDLGMVEGLHFLSMEYIDGEDLASLLRRIGRLPQDKAMEFTRKICAGLGAAHERGVLHRDLKPANIMIDGRGQPRITDFGLAGLAAEIPLSDLRSGTPAYMSPEQKAGREVTTRSDIYSLGLVLYEMFTGKARKDTQSSPSEVVKDLDPAIERVILRCLEEEPKRRPSTALAVAMGLPGGDPVAAALAAGETPSPEMVAASQEKEGFSPRTAIACFVFITVALLVGLWFNDRYSFLARAPLPKPPEAMQERAQQILETLGYNGHPADTAGGFVCCDRTQEKYLRGLDLETQNRVLASHRPAVTYYWYRQYTSEFPWTAGLEPSVTEYMPANNQPGMVKVELDALGRLIQLQAVPSWNGVAGQEPDWEAAFKAAGLDMGRFAKAAASADPPVAGDVYRGWTGTYSDDRQEGVNVHAGSWKGRIAWFEVGDHPTPLILPSFLSAPRLEHYYYTVVLFTMLFIGWRNWRAGRADTRGAVVLAGVVLAAEYAISIPAAMAFAFISFAMYLGMEPYMRRHWPDSLITWSRVFRGEFQNPLVASHVLAGITAAALLNYFYFDVIEFLSPLPTSTLKADAAAVASPLLRGLALFFQGPVVSLIFFVPFIICRLLIRRMWLADLLAALISMSAEFVSGSHTGTLFQRLAGALVVAPFPLLFIWLIRRFGLLTVTAFNCFGRALGWTALTMTGWVAERTLYLHAFQVVVAAWALWVILASQPKFEDA